jgi:hypothetical protein
MLPYITSIDTKTPMGDLVYRYGKTEYYRGLTAGFLSGVVLGIMVHCILTKAGRSH